VNVAVTARELKPIVPLKKGNRLKLAHGLVRIVNSPSKGPLAGVDPPFRRQSNQA